MRLRKVGDKSPALNEDYNRAQTSEKATFQALLHDLCKDIPDNQERRPGRPRLIGTTTNVVTAVEVLGKESSDCAQLQPLLAATAQRFQIGDVCCDKAYLSEGNLQAIADIGASAFIPFKSNSRASRPGVWNSAYHYFNLHREEFLARYHARSNAESTFSMIKRKFGDSVRAKNDVSMRNETLAKFVCHNLGCLIHAVEEFGIDPDFGCTKTNVAAHKQAAI